MSYYSTVRIPIRVMHLYKVSSLQSHTGKRWMRGMEIRLDWHVLRGEVEVEVPVHQSTSHTCAFSLGAFRFEIHVQRAHVHSTHKPH